MGCSSNRNLMNVMRQFLPGSQSIIKGDRTMDNDGELLYKFLSVLKCLRQ